MAAMASMMMKAPAALNCGAIQRNSVGHINRLPQRTLQVKCMAEDPKETSTTKGVSPSTSSKVSTKFSELEIINGRGTMVGFVSAIAVEVASGRGLLSQLNNGGVPWFVLSAAILSFGRLEPMLQRISQSQQIFSSSAAMSNGSFAMLGLLALAFVEHAIYISFNFESSLGILC